MFKHLARIAGVAVAAAALALTAGAASAAVPHARPDATSVCGSGCVDLSNYGLGAAFVANAYSGHHKAVPGRTLNLRQGSNSYTNEDFEGGFVGYLGQFCLNDGGNGQIPDTSYACLNYPSGWDVFQLEYAPDSNETGYCAGVNAATSGEAVTLIPCGETAATYWVGDRGNEATHGDCRTGAACPWLAASDIESTQQLVLTVNPESRKPVNRLSVQRELSSGGIVPDSQQFVITDGPFD